MRARYTPTHRANNIFGRLLVTALIVTVLGMSTQAASALEFVQYDIFEEGYEQWSIVGVVDVNQEESEIAEITFGGAIDGETTTTDHFGKFILNFAAPYGSLISFTAVTPTEQSETEETQLFDPAGEP